MAAFELALAAGTDGIELDVHLTGDGEIVVIHDDTVNRTTDGKGPVGAFTLAELQALDAGSWFAPSLQVKNPHLEEGSGAAEGQRCPAQHRGQDWVGL